MQQRVGDRAPLAHRIQQLFDIGVCLENGHIKTNALTLRNCVTKVVAGDVAGRGVINESVFQGVCAPAPPPPRPAPSI